MNRFFGTITIAGFLVALLCGTATAGKHPHTRGGWNYGFYVGWGWTTMSATDISQDPPLERESDSANDLTGGLRLAYNLSPQFSLGIDFAGWTGDKGWNDEVESDDFKSTVYWILAEGRWYPTGGGFYVRGGIGLGSVGIKVEGSGGSESASTSGLGWTVGAGYELRLTPKFALGALYDYRVADVGELTTYYDSVGTSTQSLTVTFTWYAI